MNKQENIIKRYKRTFKKMIDENCGLSQSFSQIMTGSKEVDGEGRVTLFGKDIYEWMESECNRKCGTKKKNLDNPSCDECDCIIADIYLAIIKLGLIEEQCEEY